MAVARQIVQSASNENRKGSNILLKEFVANELIFAVVGPAGSGTSWIAKALEQRLKTAISDVEVTVLKASDAIESWASINNVEIKSESKLARAQSLQDAGDTIRDL